MEMCKKCGVEKEDAEFSKNCRKCKECCKEHYINNRDKIIKYQKEYRSKNKNKIKKYRKEYALNNKVKLAKYNKKSHQKNKEKNKISQKEYCLKNKEKIAKYSKQYYLEYKEKLIEYGKQYNSNNKEQKKLKRNIYIKNKKLICPKFKIKTLISISINKHLKSNNTNKAGKSCLDCLPYTIEELKQHLESLFEPWMNWNNHGNYNKNPKIINNQSTWKWQLDHIIPHSTFNYTSMEDEEFKKCWALENLRPLEAKQNHIDGVMRIRH